MTKPQRALYNKIRAELKGKETNLDSVGCLYILPSAFEKGWFKLGLTKDPAKRLSLYNSSTTQNSFTYRYVSPVLYNIDNLEQAILEAMRTSNIYSRKREWFKTKYEAGYIIPMLVIIIEELSNTYSN